MPAAEARGLIPANGTLGVIAGGGSLPAVLLKACAEKGIDTFVVGFIEHTDRTILADRPHLLTRPGAAGRIMRELKRRKIVDLVWIGSLRRPSLAELRPDWRAARFYARLGLAALGDDGLLRAVRREFEREGFRLHGIQEFAGGVVGPAGPLGAVVPDDVDLGDIRRGLEASQGLGRLDIGQSVIVQEGLILGVEAVEGTDELIRRCAQYRRRGRGGILIKTAKPMQDRALDLPTIGPQTVENAAAGGLRGIVYQSGFTLLAEAQEIARLADQHKIFVLGVDTGVDRGAEAENGANHV